MESVQLYRLLGGRGLVRVRETYVRDTIVPLIAGRYVGAVKLDIVLRCLAEKDSGRLTDVAWEALHDLARPKDRYRHEPKLKRQWVGEGLQRLEAFGLVERELRPGRSSRLRVLRDDGSKGSLDDPGNVGDQYVSILGTLVEYGRLARWDAPQLCAYLAAMIAERNSRAEKRTRSLSEGRSLGGGIWYRSLDWFADPGGLRPPGHIAIPFSERTLRRGFKLLSEEGLVAFRQIEVDPVSGEPFSSPYGRRIYLNGFDDVRPGRAKLPMFGWSEPRSTGRPGRS